MSEANQGAVAAESTPEQSANEVLESIDEGNADLQDNESEDTEVSSDESINTEDATDEELEEVLDSDEATDEEKEEAAIELKKRMVFKINGKEVEKEIDLSDEEGLRELLQKGFAADEKFQSASAKEKKVVEFAQLIQKNPLKALEAAGHDMEKLATEYMEQRIADMQKSPEQKRLEELEAKIQEERERNEMLEREKQEAEQARAQEEYSRQLDTEITEALQSSELPKSPYVVKRIAETLMIAMDEGYEDVSVSDILPYVEKQIKGEIRQMFEAMPEEVIEKTLGNNVSDKLRKRRLSRQKKVVTKAADVKSTGQSEIKKAQANIEKASKKVNAKDFFSKF